MHTTRIASGGESSQTTRWLDSTITGAGKPMRREARWIALPRAQKKRDGSSYPIPDWACTVDAVRAFTSGNEVPGRVPAGLLSVPDRGDVTVEATTPSGQRWRKKRRTSTQRMNGRV